MCNDNIGRLDCPVCGLQSAYVEPESWEISDRCGWEDDPIQRAQPNFDGGANRDSLEQYRQRWRQDSIGMERAWYDARQKCAPKPDEDRN